MTEFLKQVPNIDDPVEMAKTVFDAQTEASFKTGERSNVRRLRVMDSDFQDSWTVVCRCDGTARDVQNCLRDVSESRPGNFDEAVLAAGMQNCAKGRMSELLKPVSEAMPKKDVMDINPDDTGAVQALFKVLDTPLDSYSDFPPAVLPDIQGGIESWTWAEVFKQVPPAREKLFGRAWPSLRSAAKKVGLDVTLDIPLELLQRYLLGGKE